MDTIRQLNYIFNRKQKFKILFLIIIITIGAVIELAGVTAILPFIDVAIDPQGIFDSKYLSYAYHLLGAQSTSQFLAFIAIALGLIYVVKNIYLTFMNYCIYRFTYNNQRELANRMLKGYTELPYTFFLETNSTVLMRNIEKDTFTLYDTVLAMMMLLSEGLVMLLLILYLGMTDITITIGTGVILAVFMLFYIKVFSKSLQRRGQQDREAKAGMSKWMLQTFGGIKEIKILEREKFFYKEFDKDCKRYSENHRVYQILSYIPKPIMETVCIAGIMAIVAVQLLTNPSSQTTLVTTLSVFAVAAFRLLPSFNRASGYISRIMFNKSSAMGVYKDLRIIDSVEKKMKESSSTEKIESFEKEISINNISFSYPNTESQVLQDVSFTIPKNKSVAFIGPSGAGKTTMADIILGVLKTTAGTITIDGVDISKDESGWHSKLGYIPQSIYLTDDTIRRNIAFGVMDEDIDEKRLEEALSGAQLKDFVDTLELGMETMVGESGVRLSGGQRQRIGIARALYNNPEILVLDEATSALDGETESAVMSAIDHFAGSKTLIIIAHRLTTIRNCDIVYEVSNGKIRQVEKEGLF